VNGQPPPLPPSSTPPPPPAPVPPRQVTALTPQGIGCFAKGCITLLIAAFILLAGVIGCSWYLYVKMINRVTSLAPVDVRVEVPTESQFETAENSLARLKEAIASDSETTVEFTAADLNALFARDPDFEDWRGRVRIEMADSVMTVAVSAPLHYVRIPGTKKRWFNGTAQFSFTYESGSLSLDLKSAEAADRQVPDVFLTDYTFEPHSILVNSSDEFWSHVKFMAVQGDKLVITTEAE
jgi:hypothetical protein